MREREGEYDREGFQVWNGRGEVTGGKGYGDRGLRKGIGEGTGVEKELWEIFYFLVGLILFFFSINIITLYGNLVGMKLREMEKETGCEGYGGRIGAFMICVVGFFFGEDRAVLIPM
jgi:hypothetical protein